MVAVVNPVQRRLSTQTAEIAPDTVTIRSLDWDRDRFDIEFGLQNGTTYNSFLIFGDQTALVDTSHEKFRNLYLDVLRGAVDPATIDYLIISHTEPDHSGLVPDVLALAPEVTVVGSKVALQFLEGLTHTPFKQKNCQKWRHPGFGQRASVAVCHGSQPTLARHHFHLRCRDSNPLYLRCLWHALLQRCHLR